MLLADLVRAENNFKNQVPASLSSGITEIDPKRGNTPRKRVPKVVTFLAISVSFSCTQLPLPSESSAKPTCSPLKSEGAHSLIHFLI